MKQIRKSQKSQKVMRSQATPNSQATPKSQKVRRGQLVLPFGVGAIVEVGQESYVCAELSRWQPSETLPLEPSELARITGREVRTPANSAPFVRFPRWMFCPECRRMRFFTESAEREMQEKGYPTPRCTSCWEADLTPMGFVQACAGGHLDEIDWFRWAHRNVQAATDGQCARGSAKLKFITSGARGGDWETLLVECETCGAKNNLEGLTTRPLPWKCRGRQPWMNQDGPSCDQKPGGHRRGDSNLYFPQVLSALDLVAEDDTPSGGLRGWVGEQFASGTWKGMRPTFGALGPAVVLGTMTQTLSDLAAERGVTVSAVKEAIIGYIENKPEESAPPAQYARTQEAILQREWPVLARGSALENRFVIIQPRRPGSGWPTSISAAIDRINLVSRLREVRGLMGYRRVDDTNGSEVRLHARDERSWIPGVEVWGEGIFLQFSEAHLTGWEESLPSSLLRRAAALAARAENAGRDPSRVTPRFIALHTLSHALMRRLAFDAGYSSTSLRERVYAGARMAGILIYTADGDSEGSLGGLVRMGEPGRLLRTITAALNDASWCSADPVCAETTAQGVNGLNGAACHACSLVAETSCVHSNQLLDRHFMLRLGDGRIDHGLLAVPPLSEA
jgi:hypothetical protein